MKSLKVFFLASVLIFLATVPTQVTLGQEPQAPPGNVKVVKTLPGTGASALTPKQLQVAESVIDATQFAPGTISTIAPWLVNGNTIGAAVRVETAGKEKILLLDFSKEAIVDTIVAPNEDNLAGPSSYGSIHTREVVSRSRIQGWTPTLSWLGIYEDVFPNWDFGWKYASSYNVDWPVGIVFYGPTVTVGSIHSTLDRILPYVGGRMYMPINDGDGWYWDNDFGNKGTACPGLGEWTRHARSYADWGGALENQGWLQYVLVTVHYDGSECGSNHKCHGYSEYAENYITYQLAMRGYTVFENTMRFYNREDFRVATYDEPGGVQRTYIYDNDGRASFVYLP